ncbi:MAG TPA: radical SAM family heme chaperone HemW [Bacteroidetes bacterium]|nr:radical SAM family heme chaperone HemW [Bacteroidota bacterium]
MAGIYLHIPFCKQKCHYCNFYSLASVKYRDVFVDALLREMHLRKDYLHGQSVQTVYFGGGTPSLLTTEEINRILTEITKLFALDAEAEITLEANPDDLTPDYLRHLKSHTRVNRLSIGIQSFFDDDLAYLHRVHNGKQAIKAVEQARQAGFQNLTIDLIYGIPTLTEEKWRRNLAWFFELGIPHLSSYALTVEPKTALQVLIDRNKTDRPEEDHSIRHFEILLDQTEKHGFVQYEISNFALPGFYSKHNSAYWLGGHYLGLGPSAHSFNGLSRQWNVANMKKYVESETVEKIVLEKEILTENQRYNEYILTSLRTSWGCDTEHIRNGFGEKYEHHFLRHMTPFLQEKKVEKRGNAYMLTNNGKLFADGIAAALFMEED